MSDEKTNQTVKLDRYGVSRLLQITVTMVISGVILFACAGRLDWLEAWMFFAIYFLCLIIGGTWIILRDPGVFNERGKVTKNVKPWDVVILIVYTVLWLSLFVVSGLDVRYGWSVVPTALKITGGVIIVLSLMLICWVMATNTFVATAVRIQEDRGHHVISSGPYSVVRHPMYTGAILFILFGVPFLLGSWWGMIPGALILMLFIIRIGYEEKTLHAELPGYTEYTQKVRYRLLPGLW